MVEDFEVWTGTVSRKGDPNLHKFQITFLWYCTLHILLENHTLLQILDTKSYRNLSSPIPDRDFRLHVPRGRIGGGAGLRPYQNLQSAVHFLTGDYPSVSLFHEIALRSFDSLSLFLAILRADWLLIFLSIVLPKYKRMNDNGNRTTTHLITRNL